MPYAGQVSCYFVLFIVRATIKGLSVVRGSAVVKLFSVEDEDTFMDVGRRATAFSALRAGRACVSLSVWCVGYVAGPCQTADGPTSVPDGRRHVEMGTLLVFCFTLRDIFQKKKKCK